MDTEHKKMNFVEEKRSSNVYITKIEDGSTKTESNDMLLLTESVGEICKN